LRAESCSQAVSKPVRHIPLLCVQWKTPDDGQRNCPKHVEFYSKNKFVRPDPARKLSANLYDILLLCVQWETPDDGQRNCPKHVEFYSKNRFEKIVNLVCFIIRIYHVARSPERKYYTAKFCSQYDIIIIIRFTMGCTSKSWNFLFIPYFASTFNLNCFPLSCAPAPAQDFISHVNNGLTAPSDLTSWTSPFPFTMPTVNLFTHPYQHPLSDSSRKHPASFTYKWDLEKRMIYIKKL